MDVFRKITQIGFGIVSVASLALLFTAAPLEAAKQPKVDICHLDQDTGLYKLLSVSLNAQAAHLNHGDKEVPASGDCNEQPPKVFARAYINIDGQPGYNAVTDIIIAQVVDGNGDNIFNVGDLLELGAYPKDFNDLSIRGTFGASANPLPITDFSNSLPTHIGVRAGGQNFEFDNIVNVTIGEAFQEFGPLGSLYIADNPGGSFDAIFIYSSSLVSQPEGPWNISRSDTADSDFINVEINLAGL